MRTINSPGVEIKERDLSLSPVFPAGTNIFMTGFAAKGPTDEVLQITGADELEQVYGIPTTPAERYLHFSARQILQSSSGNVFINRLPYGSGAGEGFGNTYGALVYPVAVATEDTSTLVYRASGTLDATYFPLSTTDVAVLTLYPVESGGWLLADVLSLTANGLTYPTKKSDLQYELLVETMSSVWSTTEPTLTAAYLARVDAISSAFVAGADTLFTTTIDTSGAVYLLGEPKFFELSQAEYLSVLDGTAYTSTGGTWSVSAAPLSEINSIADFGKAGLVVLNVGQTTINTKAEGYYFGLTDNTNATPATDHDSIVSVKTVTKAADSNGVNGSEYTRVPESRLYFSLSATNDAGFNRNAGSLSNDIESAFYKYSDSTTDKFDDILAASVYKLRQSPYTNNAIALEYVNVESFLGSLDYYRQIQSQNGGPAISYFLPGDVETKSANVRLLVNENISNRKTSTWLDNSGYPTKKIRLISHSAINGLTDFKQSQRFGVYAEDVTAAAVVHGYADSLFPLGVYSNLSFTSKDIGSVTLKVDRALSRVENDEVYDIDIIAEAGLGTIYSVTCACGLSYYDDTIMPTELTDALDLLTTSNDYQLPQNSQYDLRGNYHAVFSKFEEFCSNARRDCLFIADPLRHIFVRGANTLTLSNPTRSFSQYIYSALRHNLELANSSYACTYGNWIQVNDPYAGINCWVPFSGWAAADMASTDANFQPWYAPAGFTRGLVSSALALAITPKQKERDQLYKLSINPVAFFPAEGFVIFGQKTLLKQPSAFDRINVRRLFLYLEKAVKKTTRYFIFEPNTLFTRTRVVDTLTPIFELARNTEGLYDYLILANERNNTPDVIDRNEMVVDIYLKPVRTAEFILVNFIATRTGTNLQETVS